MAASEILNAPPLKTPWQYVECRTDSARANMEADGSLFEAVKKDPSAPPVLRFFRWERPALSYGRTQGVPPASVEEARKKGWDAVKRPTGGGKVLHGNDLCFSLIWRKGTPNLPWSVMDSYRLIHLWILRSLERTGTVTEAASKEMQKPLNEKGWCFENPVQYDLMLEGRKIAGGAQWRDGDAALHQGSIQLEIKDGDLEVFKDVFSEMFRAGLTLTPRQD